MRQLDSTDILVHHLRLIAFVSAAASLVGLVSSASAQNSFSPDTVAAAPVAAPMSATVQPADNVPVTHAAPSNSRLFTVPVLQAGKAAWVSVYDRVGHPVAGVSVLVNGQPHDTDSLGQASFTVPTESSVDVALAGESGKAFASISYGATPGGWLVSQTDAKQCIDRVEETVVASEMAPAVAYAPATIESDQTFVVIGKNFSGKADGDHILVDGYDAEVFAGSPACLLAVAPKRMPAGALRELYVTANGEVSNTTEVDVCRLELSSAVEPQEPARLRVIGSNIPALVEIATSAAAGDISFAGHKLGGHGSVITPGGDSNSVPLEVTNPQQLSSVELHMVGNAPWSPDDHAFFSDPNLKAIVCELNRGEIVRLKRRLIAIENRINEEDNRRTKLLSSGGLSAEEQDKLNAELRTLANRQRRIGGMVVSRRAIFQALGGSDNDYRLALEEASGGATSSLEKNLTALTHPLVASVSVTDTKDTSEDVAAQEKKDLEESVLAMTKLWTKMPTKIAHGTRLAPPPEPYMPSGDELGPMSGVSYEKYLKLVQVPPEPLGVKEFHIPAHHLHHHVVKVAIAAGHHSSRHHMRHHHRHHA